MRVPDALASAFGENFEETISRFAHREGLLPEPEAVRSHRFLSRSVVPHVKRLSEMFNRLGPEDPGQDAGLDPYWKQSSNPANLRLAYFLYFMPSNLFRGAAVWSELARLGFRWPAGRELRGIELGAGPASGACGISAGEWAGMSDATGRTGLSPRGNWALIERDLAMLKLGASWLPELSRFVSSGSVDWGARVFHRELELGEKSLLPRSAPKFNLWVMSYFLNEVSLPPEQVATTLLETWERHLDEEGIAILVEPALKLQSRKLLELRATLLRETESRRSWLQVLLPCLGHQACGALADPEDWCHEEALWWRPPYFREIDRLAGLDRKSLPFSYLVLIRSRRPRQEILPALAEARSEETYRLVSPAHAEGRELEFFLCGQEGKRRARFRPAERDQRPGSELGRGDILLGAELRGDTHSSRVQTLKKIG